MTRHFRGWIALFVLGTLLFFIHRDAKFLRLFGVMVSQLSSVSLAGGLVGVTAGILVFRSGWMTRLTLCLLHSGIWAPLLLFWPLPIWFGADNDRFLIFSGWAISATAVALSACYRYLIIQSTLGLEWHTVRAHLVRAIVVQGLLVSLIFHVIIDRLDWFSYPGSKETPLGYSALVLLAGFLFLLDRMSRFNFDHTARLQATILEKKISRGSRCPLGGALLVGFACLGFWHLLNIFGFYPLISSPLDVLEAVYLLLFAGERIAAEGTTIWIDIGISLLEILVGLILGAGLALSVVKILSNNVMLQKRVLPLLSLTNIVPFLLPIFVLSLVRVYLGPKQTIAGVVLLSFFPFIQVLWGLRNRPLPFRILMASGEALPFAFVAMIFGETLNAVAGLGFLMAIASATRQTAKGLAVSLIIFCTFILFSSVLQAIANRLVNGVKL